MTIKLTKEAVERLRSPNRRNVMLRYPEEDHALFEAVLDLALRALDTEADARLGAAVRDAFSFSGSAPFEFGKIVDACRGVIDGPLWDALCEVRDAIDADALRSEADR